MTDHLPPLTMQAFAIVNPGDKEGHLVTVPIPTPGPNEALIQVLRAGVCNTDLELLQGYMGYTGVLGHEFVGRVVQVNTTSDAVREEWQNQRVCGDINVGCSSCDVCAGAWDGGHRVKMRRNHCPRRSVLGILKKNGTMAEYVTLPIHNLHKVPYGIDNVTAAFAEPLAAACRIVEQGLINYDKERPDKVAILGDGKLGLMIAEVLGREHAKRFMSSTQTDNGDNNNHGKYQPPVIFGKHKYKLDMVSKSGVDCRPVSECIDKEAYNGASPQHAGKYDVVVDATGSPAGLSLAAALCRPMGTLVLKSTCAAGEQFNAAPFVIDELRVIGSRCGPIDVALDLLATGTTTSDPGNSSSIPPLRVEKYVTETFPLAQAVEAIQCAAEKSTMKVQILCSSDA